MFDCAALAHLPPTLGCLAHIYELDLSGCSALVELPDSLGDLQQLLRCAAASCATRAFAGFCGTMSS